MNNENLCAVCAERLAAVAGPKSLTVGAITVDLSRRLVETASGQDIALTPTQYRMLALLVAHYGNVVAYDTLSTALRESGSHKDDRGSVKVHISRIRRACREAGVVLVVDSNREYGYILTDAQEDSDDC